MSIKWKDRAAEYRRLKYQQNRAEFFQDKKCSKCGSLKKLLLHHLDPKTKISSNDIWRWGRAKKLAEIAKCVVLCHPCHMKLHNTKPTKHGTLLEYQWHKCRCPKCRRVASISNVLYKAGSDGRSGAAEAVIYLIDHFGRGWVAA